MEIPIIQFTLFVRPENNSIIDSIPSEKGVKLPAKNA